jgi:glycerol-3-phosphate dehydrogenase (NAD(P)+)
MPLKKPFAVLGAGNAGTAFAALISRHKRPVQMYCIEQDVELEINEKGLNSKYLHGVKLPKNIKAFADIGQALKGAEIVIVAVPHSVITGVMELAAPYLSKDAILGVITKGLEPKTGAPIAFSSCSILPTEVRRRLCVIGGPAIATDIADQKPSALMLGGKDMRSVKKLAGILKSPWVKVASSSDVSGIAYAMALKNVYAIALGMCDGLKYPMNTKAMIMTYAMHEMQNILHALGAKKETAVSLAGLGDLIVTGMSPHGRNRLYGERLVGSKTSEPSELGIMTVEGRITARVAGHLLRSRKIKAPLVETVVACIYAKKQFERPFINFLNNITF